MDASNLTNNDIIRITNIVKQIENNNIIKMTLQEKLQTIATLNQSLYSLNTINDKINIPIVSGKIVEIVNTINIQDTDKTNFEPNVKYVDQVK